MKEFFWTEITSSESLVNLRIARSLKIASLIHFFEPYSIEYRLVYGLIFEFRLDSKDY